ncbi:hypothetical protein DYBT9623_03699 [Dyadobacter sp. CECT 9623]|uniref:DUF6265 domain-containing protein n=1 Tax=Dyadobacter linearis TaxID=2823330 RepID=A0ABN7RAC3_9BACT|nr:MULTISPECIES: DUF6265 family protein [unclassified Dyadobacter]MCE7062530.1 DUF6265 family protein [Dyadobacter sp. CY343]CAG5071709.1 hypothetical protein DYBT9623_03699 [Dyadobacter sp. CECT 9623]
MLHFNKIRSVKIFSLLFTFLLLGGVSNAQTATGTLNDLNFLEGHWLGTYNGGPIEASWTAPAGGNIMGYIRMIKDDKPALYEVFAFEQTEKGPVARVKHFKPGLIALEEKDVSDTYNFIEAKKNQALFEKDDISVRIIYERRSQNQLVIQRGKMENNKWVFVDLFVFNRIP